MSARRLFVLSFVLPLTLSPGNAQTASPVFGYRDFSVEAKVEKKFLATPSAKLAGRHLKRLTAEPHLAATPGDHDTALYVADKFRAAGLDTEIVPYRVLLNQPLEERVEAFDAAGKILMHGPTPEHIEGEPYENNPRAVMPFHGSSGSGDITAEAIYANYCRKDDFDRLFAHHLSLNGKIVLCRYGDNFRGVKVYLAQMYGAAGVLIYSDPQDDGFKRGPVYPNGPWRPETAVQRGSVQFLFKYAGDPETPGIASTPSLPDSARLPNDKTGNQPSIVSIPLSWHDAEPILRAMTGPEAPKEWQGGLPFKYHLGVTGQGGVRVHLVSRQDYQRRIIWDVIGTLRGARSPDETVVVGNHRDGWVYGAVDPSSGTAAMLETIHGFGTLVKHGWRPARTVVFCSWDAEEEGLIGSTEWVEQHEAALQNAVAYFNVDVAVSGPDFSAAAVPSLKPFIREIAQAVPSPKGGSVYEQWKLKPGAKSRPDPSANSDASPAEVRVGDLGSGSDYTPFLQHEGVPSVDIGSGGPYGVYHSVFDDYAWFTQNADPKFAYLQQMARVLGLEALRMADTDVLPYDYVNYARELGASIEVAKKRAGAARLSKLDFAPAEAAAARFTSAAEMAHARQLANPADPSPLNHALRRAESAFLNPAGLPNRPWYRHTVFAPGEFTGYAVMVLPGVNEAIEAHDLATAEGQLAAVTEAIERSAAALESAR